MSSGVEDGSSVALNILIMGIASIFLSMVGLMCGPAFFAGPVLGIMAALRGFKHSSRVQAGEITPGGEGLALAGGIAGALGALEGICMFCCGGGALLFLAVTGQL
jgi:hypothetical protein